MTTPHVFQGLHCSCPERHHQGAGYYVSVEDGGRHVLVAGPYPEHGDALAMVETVKRVVLDKWNPGGRAHFYGYGTASILQGHPMPAGKLNREVGA